MGFLSCFPPFFMEKGKNFFPSLNPSWGLEALPPSGVLKLTKRGGWDTYSLKEPKNKNFPPLKIANIYYIPRMDLVKHN